MSSQDIYYATLCSRIPHTRFTWLGLQAASFAVSAILLPRCP